MRKLIPFLLLLVCCGNSLPVPRQAEFFVQTPASSGGGGGSTVFITAGHGSSTRHDFPGIVGFGFTVPSAITITDLGRIVVSGNSATHIVYLEDASGNVIVQTSPLTTSGVTADTYVYGAVTHTSLSTGVNYFILSAETLNGDDWYNDNAAVTPTADGSMVGSAFANSTGILVSAGTSGNKSFVPTNFKYTKP